MFLAILKFELAYRLKRPATFIYFTILFFTCFLAVTTDIITVAGASGQIKENAPSTLTNIMLIISAFFTVITSAIMGVPVVRDFEHKTEAIFFSNPIKKRDYLLGRFTGSFIILSFVFTGMVFGLIAGDLMPFRNPDRMVSFNLWHYLYIFIVFVLPNLFFSGALFFATGALSRKMIVVYTQAIILLVLYLISLQYTSVLENTTLAAMLDPFAIVTYQIQSQYWSITELNTLPIPFTGVVFYNRTVWIMIGILSLVITYYKFDFTMLAPRVFAKKKITSLAQVPPMSNEQIPHVTTTYNTRSHLYTIIKQSLFYFRIIWKEIPFIAIVICGMIITISGIDNINRMYGTHSLPTTYAILELIRSFNLFFFIILVVYSGELISREKAIKIDLITDALPVSNAAVLLGKFFGLILVYITLLFVLIVTGIIIQLINGYYQFDVPLYFQRLYTETLSILILFTMLSFFVQVLVNNKYIGYATMVLIFITLNVMPELGITHSLLRFASINIGTYSDMNGFGHFIQQFAWYDAYWFFFAVVIFGVATLFIVRGTTVGFKSRWQSARVQLSPLFISFCLTAILLFSLSGCYIFYRTNIVHTYSSETDEEESMAAYEKTLSQFSNVLQPKITSVSIALDLYPDKRSFDAKGYYCLTNKSHQDIHQVHVQFSQLPEQQVKSIRFDPAAKTDSSYASLGYWIYHLPKPLAPGDSVRMNFELTFLGDDFSKEKNNTDIIYNGTFLNNNYFPSIGYDHRHTLTDPGLRRRYELPERYTPQPSDSGALQVNIFGDDSNRINFEMIIGTDQTQTAVAPGVLMKHWTNDGRSFFHYKGNTKMINLYAVASARYSVVTDTWTNNTDTVGLEIYHHHGHHTNLTRMLESMRASLQYYTTQFGPYQFKQLRIVEFPRYSNFAQSFAATIPYSEGMGFMLDKREGDLDMIYYITAHEVAHQWWGHQIVPANVPGATVLTETLSQYSALMVMKQTYPEAEVEKFLKYELDFYLKGRSGEVNYELPLSRENNQNYIHYNKGTLVMYALQDYIGEEKVNVALRKFIEAWAFRTDVYPTTTDLIQFLKAETPQHLQYLFADMFQNITLYENRGLTADYSQKQNGCYLVKLAYEGKKILSDSVGITKEIGMDDLIDIGIYGKSDSGESALIYMKKHRLKTGVGEIVISTTSKPDKVIIDPMHKLIDRSPEDNGVSIGN